MEKRKPHYNLSLIKEAIATGQVRAAMSALAGGAALGFDFAGILAVVAGLTSNDFYKSMTTYANHQVWQDVYRPQTVAGDVYLKLTVIEDVLIISFKEL